MTRPPEVYAAINRVAAALASRGIAKASFNLDGGYFYRSIDEVTAAVAPLMAAERLSLLPRRHRVRLQHITGPGGTLLTHASLAASFEIVCADDASSHRLQIAAEALDDSDKATAKAVSGAFKHVLLQLFCIPVPGLSDSDRSNLKPFEAMPEPEGGWAAWASKFRKRLGRCRHPRDIGELEADEGARLASLMRSDATLYRQLGRELAEHEASIAAGTTAKTTPRRRRTSKPSNIIARESTP